MSTPQVPEVSAPKNAQARLDGFARKVGHITGEDTDHFDSSDTVMFARSLDDVRARTYDVKYPELKRNLLFPNVPIDPAAETITYRQYDELGEAQEVHDYAKDFHTVDLKGAEFIRKVVSIGDSYQYSIQDLRAAKKVGFALEAKKAMAARHAIERKLEKLVLAGNAEGSVYGVYNHPNVSKITGTGQSLAGSDLTGKWDSPSTSIQTILDDISIIGNKIHNDTKGEFEMDTLALDTKVYGFLASRQRSTVFAEDSVLEYILKQNPWLKAIEFWPYLDAAGTSGSAGALAYKRDPEVIEQRVAVEFEQFAPQPIMMAMVTPCHSRHGGIAIMYPKAVLIIEGLRT